MTSPFEWAFFAITVLICWVPALMFVVGDIRGVLARRRQAREEQQAAEAYNDVVGATTCPGCGKLFFQSGRPGRPRKWCTDQCREQNRVRA